MKGINTFERNAFGQQMLKELELVKGNSTAMVSFYMSAGCGTIKVLNFLKKEINLTKNIKSEATKKSISDSLNSLINIVKTLTDEDFTNDTALFAGTINNKSYVKILKLDTKTNFQLYKCGSEFFLEPLYNKLKPKNVYLIIAIEIGQMSVGYFDGSNIYLEKTIDSMVPGKHGMGGQSSNRFMREINRLRGEFLDECHEQIGEFYEKFESVEGVLIGGPNMTINEFMERKRGHKGIKEKAISFVPIDSTGLPALRRILELSESKMAEHEYFIAEKEIKNFISFYHQLKAKNWVTLENFCSILSIGEIRSFIVTKDCQLSIYQLVCTNCETILHSPEPITPCIHGTQSSEIPLIDLTRIEKNGYIIEDVGEHGFFKSFHEFIFLPTQQGKSYIGLK